MKKLLLICSILMASCHFGEVESIPEATKLSITNNSLVDLYDVRWNGVLIDDYIGPGDLVEKQLEGITERITPKNTGTIIFKTRGGVTYQTREPVTCKYLRREDFRFNPETEVKNSADQSRLLKELENAY